MVGLVKKPGANSSDNGLLFSATFLSFFPRGTIPNEWINWYENMVNLCRKEPGLFNRYPDNLSLQAHDDMIGLAFADFWIQPIYHKGWAREVLQYGWDHGWVFNNTNGPFEPRMWRFRSIHYPSFLKFVAGCRLTPWDVFAICSGFVFNMFEKGRESNGRCLLVLMARCLSGHSWIIDFAIGRWLRVMRERFPGGLRDLYSEYFKPTPEEHPFVTYAPDTWDVF